MADNIGEAFARAVEACRLLQVDTAELHMRLKPCQTFCGETLQAGLNQSGLERLSDNCLSPVALIV